jgi:hypothetical protein
MDRNQGFTGPPPLFFEAGPFCPSQWAVAKMKKYQRRIAFTSPCD